MDHITVNTTIYTVRQILIPFTGDAVKSGSYCGKYNYLHCPVDINTVYRWYSRLRDRGGWAKKDRHLSIKSPIHSKYQPLPLFHYSILYNGVTLLMRHSCTVDCTKVLWDDLVLGGLKLVFSFARCDIVVRYLDGWCEGDSKKKFMDHFDWSD